MNYEETVGYIMSALPMFQRVGAAAYKPNLDNSHALDLYDASPHEDFLTIHVAGTNGKGSVSHMLAAILTAAGYRTGLLTSPHLLDYRERIRVDGQMVSEDFITQYVDSHLEVFEEISPSFFEMSVAMAFSYFADQQVDIAVVEVGMGGRLDSTNIISPTVSVITSIGYDHMAFLGGTMAEIAGEKAGIIKQNRPVVVGAVDEELRPVFIDRAREMGSPYTFAQDRWTVVPKGASGERQCFDCLNSRSRKPMEIVTDLRGIVQSQNLATVLCVVDYLRREGLHIPWTIVQQGLGRVQQSTGLAGRWQPIDEKPLTIADVAHNPQGIAAVLAQVEQTPHEGLLWVLGLSGDKDVSSILAMLPSEATYFFTRAGVPRAMDADALRGEATGHGLRGESYPDVASALRAARERARPEDLIMVGGSAFVVADALAAGVGESGL
ncbi:MAG: dihydrofolate synthase [Bacteroidia bacterium]|nr:MAG: dihydrofolate synthase [Bacteroidia bacterium]